MRTLLAIFGLFALMGMAYSMGSQRGDAGEELGDPFEGLGLGHAARTNITVVCKQQSPRGAGPTQECIASQAAALKSYERMQGIYPRRSSGGRALKRCWENATDSSRFTDYRVATSCTEREIGSIDSGRLGKVKVIY